MYGKSPDKVLICTVKTRKLMCRTTDIMETKTGNNNNRIEFRISDADKQIVEYAKDLSGFKSFSEFIRFIITRESKAIVAEENQILVSQRDKEVFFNALMGVEEPPNEALLSAIRFHEEITGK